MRLISCHINNFGKLHDLTMDFDPKLCVINEENGYGKSTLATFIKVMFFGFDNDRSRDPLVNERKHFKPWQEGAYGGSIRFEAGGKEYSVARIFGSKESEDSFSLRNAVTNLESTDFSENLGEEIFGIDSDSFKKTIYISQSEVTTESTDSINARMGNLSLMTNDLSKHEKVDARLKKEIDSLSSTRATGTLYKLKAKMTELSSEIKKKPAIEQSISEVTAKKKENEDKLSQLKISQKELADTSRKLSERNELRLRKADYNSLMDKAAVLKERVFAYTLDATEEENLRRTSDILAGNAPTEEEITEITEAIANMRTLSNEERSNIISADDRSKFSELDGLFCDSEITEKSASSAIADMNEAVAKENALVDKRRLLEAYEKEERDAERKGINKIFIGFIVAGILFAIGGLVLIIGKQLIPSVVLLVIGLIFIIAGLAFKLKKPSGKEKDTPEKEKREALLHEIEEEEKHIERLRANVSHILSLSDIAQGAKDSERLNSIRNMVYDYENMKLEMAEKEKNSRLQEIKDLNAKVREFLGRYYFIEEEPEDERYVITDSYIKYLEDTERNLENDVETNIELSGKKAEYIKAIKDYEERKKAADEYLRNTKGLNDFILEKEDEEATKNESETLNEVNEKLNDITLSMDGIRENIQGYERREDDLYEELEQIREYEEELVQDKQDYENLRDKAKLLKKTKELLIEAKENFTAQYMAPLLSAFGKYYKRISEQDADMFTIDANMNLYVNEYGADREVDFLSRGSQDLVGMAFRMALVEAMYKGEKPFVICDDPFTDFDEVKVKNGMSFIKEISEDYQVIYFTCHSSRSF